MPDAHSPTGESTLDLGRAGVGTVVGAYVVEVSAFQRTSVPREDSDAHAALVAVQQHIVAGGSDAAKSIVWRETVTSEAVGVALTLFKNDMCFRLSPETRNALHAALTQDHESYTGLWPSVHPNMSLDLVDRRDAWHGYKAHVADTTKELSASLKHIDRFKARVAFVRQHIFVWGRS